jgi:hypothetical protein
MKSLFWASTHPAFTIHGYKCVCGNISETMPDHFIHVFLNHDEKVASEVLSWRELEKYVQGKSNSNGYKFSYKGFRLSKFGDLGFYQARKGRQGFIGESLKELIKTIEQDEISEL